MPDPVQRPAFRGADPAHHGLGAYGEGPVWHAAGYVTFVDLAGSRRLRWDPNGQVIVVREHTGEGNGCSLDRQGRLIMCEGADHRRITRMDAAGTVTTLAERRHGQQFNRGYHDLWYTVPPIE